MEINADGYGNWKKQKIHHETYPIITPQDPTLQLRAAVKFSTLLLLHSDLRPLYINHCHGSLFPYLSGTSIINSSTKCGCLELILSKLIDKLNRLSLSEQWNQILLNVCRPVGQQILTWVANNYNLFSYSRNTPELLDSLRWSDEGIIDEVKTVNALFLSRKFKYGSYTMFDKCSKHCIENKIFMLRPREIPEEPNRFLRNIYSQHFTTYWACVVQNQQKCFLPKVIQADPHGIYNIEHSIYKNMITLSVQESNIVALKYFWKKITTEEVNSFIHEWVRMASGKIFVPKQSPDSECISEASNVFIFLLSQLATEDQKECIGKYTESVLWASFCDLPWQRHFLPVFQAVVDVLPEDKYVEMIKILLSSGRSVKPLLFSVWSTSPQRLKKIFISDVCRWNTGYVLLRLLKDHDSETVRLILSLADVPDLEKMFSGSFVENRDLKITGLVLSDQVPILDLLMRESRLSKAFVCNLKFEMVKSCLDPVCQKWISEGKFEAADNFLRWGCSSQDVIDNFKKIILNRLNIVHTLIQKDLFDFLEKFLTWCCTSDEDLSAFKKQVLSESHVLSILCCLSRESLAWHRFNKFLCVFKSDLVIGRLKKNVSESKQLSTTVFSMLDCHNLKFCKEFLRWCFISDERVAQYKRRFILSHLGFSLFTQRIYTVMFVDSFAYWKTMKLFAKWFHPIPKNTIDEFKSMIRQDERWSVRGNLFHAEERLSALFWLLDNVTLDTSGDDVDIWDDLDPRFGSYFRWRSSYKPC